MAQDFLKPTVGGVLLDVSCGSGLFTRRFAQSGDFKAVIALDFSENMLRQTYEFIKQDRLLTAVYSPNCFSPLFCWQKTETRDPICTVITHNYASRITADGYEVVLNAQGHSTGQGRCWEAAFCNRFNWCSACWSSLTLLDLTCCWGENQFTNFIPSSYENYFQCQNFTYAHIGLPQITELSGGVTILSIPVDIQWSSCLQVSEISRILKPGGVFVATTYVLSPLLDFGNKELHKVCCISLHLKSGWFLSLASRCCVWQMVLSTLDVAGEFQNCLRNQLDILTGKLIFVLFSYASPHSGSCYKVKFMPVEVHDLPFISSLTLHS